MNTLNKTSLFLIPALALLFQGPLKAVTPIKPQQGEDETGHWIRDYYHFKTESIDNLEADIDFGMGELVLTANPRGKMIDGNIRYYKKFSHPDVDYRTLGNQGELNIDLETDDDHEINIGWDSFKSIGRGNGDKFNNELEFSLPKEVVTDLNLDFGMGEARLDLTGLSLSKVDLNCGMSDVQVDIDKVNPVTCRYLHIDSGMGAFTASGIGNLRAQEIHVEVGLGSADLDMRGYIQEDLKLDVEVGLGSMELTLPKDVNIKAKIHDNFLSSVDVDDLVKKGNTYYTEDWDDDRPTIELDVSVGLGSVDIDLRN